MPRSISVIRRTPGVIDLTVRRRPGIIGFRFSAAANFDSAVFTAFQVVPNYGYKSLTAPDLGGIGNQFRDLVRFLFNPSDYTATVAAVRDDVPFYIKIESQNLDGTFNPAEAMHMIMPAHWTANRPILLQGTVPAGLTQLNSIEIQLPMSCIDWEIQNDGAADIYMSFERGAVAGPEYRLQPATSIFRSMEQYVTTVSQIFMRGAKGSTTVSAIFTARNERFA